VPSSFFPQIPLLALGVAASPVPVVAVLIILLTERARVSSLVFATSWVLGNALAITIAIVLAGQIRRPLAGYDLPYEGTVTALLGIGLVVGAWLSRRGRLRSGEQSDPPTWVRAVDNLSPVGGAVVAFSNATTSPKNLALAIGAGAFIRSATRIQSQWVEGGVLYVTIASVTVVLPVLVYFIAGTRAEPVLARWKSNITARAAVGMELTLLVLGISLAAKGLLNLLT
jgi:hypothetical protein